ncbi:Neutral protease-like protein [Lachnellula occidentalis]|uniref:Neutral protease 2 n=1 Tax=Lachnellula occidentalis TaxID=215460 RepID=A0A8H8UIX3_9HELO|nr:Neutral protease-like protein [Lachnellula occidentalis]
MHFAQVSLFLAAVANAAFLQNGKRDTGLEVTLTAAEGSAADVVATVKNVGTESLNLLTLGTFLDAAPVQKLAVVDEANVPVAFTGIYRSIQYSGDLSDDYFKLLAAGESVNTTINTAAVHDLKSGTYSFSAEGAIPFAVGESKELADNAVTYKTNVLTMAVDGEAVALRPKAIPEMTLAERTVLQSGCTTSNRAATTAALSSCASLARAASTAARSGSSSKFSEYFRTTSSSVRSTVAARLSAVATQCGSLTSGGTDYYCTDVYGYCESNVLAYTIPSTDEIVNCPLYYSALPLLSSTCHAQDRATTSLHEMTHAPATYSPGTDDNAYGYSASIALSSSSAVLNADSYALYANAIYVGC